MNQKTRILHLLRSNQFSGAENVVCQIINMFGNEQYDMVYCSTDGEIRKALMERGITFYPLQSFSLSEIRQIVREYQPKIIHAHDISASVAAALVKGKARIISHMHVNHQHMSRINIRTLLFLICSNTFKHIFWVSNSAYQDYKFQSWLAAKSSILYNIVDGDYIYQKAGQDENTYQHDVIYVGRLSYQKNPHRLLRVLRLVVDEKPDCKALIVGEGELMDEIQQLSQALGLENNISFTGFRSNPLKMIQDAKVMLMTSRFEGTPMCALEAMALGVPIVSTPTDGMVDLVDNRVSGYLADNDIELAKAIIELTADENKRAHYSANVVNRFKHINDLEEYKQQIARAYTRCVNMS